MLTYRIHVLLVEDNPEDADVMQEILSGEATSPFKLTRAENLSSAMKLLAQGGFDVVLLDLVLPDSEGLETLTRTREQFPDVPIIVLTASDDQALAIQAFKSGAQDYLIKGYIQVYPTLVQSSIRYTVERRRAERGLKHEEAGSERVSRRMTDRDEDLSRLRREVNTLLAELGRPPKYPV